MDYYYHHYITFLCYIIKTPTSKQWSKTKPIKSLKFFPSSSFHLSWFANLFFYLLHQCYNDPLLTTIENWIVPLKKLTPFFTCNLHGQNKHKNQHTNQNRTNTKDYCLPCIDHNHKNPSLDYPQSTMSLLKPLRYTNTTCDFGTQSCTMMHCLPWERVVIRETCDFGKRNKEVA